MLGSKPVAAFESKGACAGDSIQLVDRSSNAFGDLIQWNWSTNSPGRIVPGKPAKIVFDSSGLSPVSLVVQSHLGCRSDTFTKMIQVEGKPQVDFQYQKDCFGNIQYSGQQLDTSYIQRWYYNLGDGYFSIERDSQHFYQRDGDYWIRLLAYSRHGCLSDTVVKPIRIERVHAYAGRDTIIAAGQPLQLDSRTSSNQVKWTPAIGLNDPFFIQPTAVLQNDQTYVLEVTNADGCVAKDTVYIRVFEKEGLYIPNAFTPNGDGRNDYLRPFIPGLSKLLQFSIYNRWGQLIFDTTTPDKGWDGMSNSKPCAVGTYVWLVRYQDHSGQMQIRKGTVSLIR
jgi:gliding motility-associated-like protein